MCINKVDAAKQNKVEGEAKFIRGASYFELVRLFGKAYNDGSPTTNLGVPIV
ncbi:RagB/SusD family nutrient uptake outer membrane protein [Algibacter miyuki]|uniref:RagB/SusD family nutrient uptake outer membrane protein n=1 Tax=Algibacter miyuki TaxID=1306933 RepID=UPI003B004589